MRVHYIQHVPFENLGNIEPWLKHKNFEITSTKVFENHVFPEINEFDFLIVLGGPMNIHEEDQYCWLKEEKKFLKNIIDTQKPILGICLGAQLIADALGSRIYKNTHKEIGWHSINLTKEALNSRILIDLPKKLNVFHWHGDTFDLPEGSIRIAKSDACQNQGFIFENRIVGLQFHLESNRQSVINLCTHCKDKLISGEFIQTKDKLLSDEAKFEMLQKYLHKFLDNYFS